jgi:hypothetical protein
MYPGGHDHNRTAGPAGAHTDPATRPSTCDPLHVAPTGQSRHGSASGSSTYCPRWHARHRPDPSDHPGPQPARAIGTFAGGSTSPPTASTTSRESVSAGSNRAGPEPLAAPAASGQGDVMPARDTSARPVTDWKPA